MVAIDQYGSCIFIPGKHPRKELLSKLYAKHADKIYYSKRDGSTFHIGYIIQRRWFTLYQMRELPK